MSVSGSHYPVRLEPQHPYWRTREELVLSTNNEWALVRQSWNLPGTYYLILALINQERDLDQARSREPQSSRGLFLFSYCLGEEKQTPLPMLSRLFPLTVQIFKTHAYVLSHIYSPWLMNQRYCATLFFLCLSWYSHQFLPANKLGVDNLDIYHLSM